MSAGLWRSYRALCVIGAAMIAGGVLLAATPQAQPPAAGVLHEPWRVPPAPPEIWVDARSGQDNSPGTRERPLKTISAAIAMLPDPLRNSVVIHVAGAPHASTGGRDMPAGCLALMRRMYPGVCVRIVGEAAADARPVLNWEGGEAMIDAREGDWWLENLQIASGSTRQRRGVMSSGTAHVTLRNVTIRTCSHSDTGIYATHGGRISLRGAILLNEHLHDGIQGESFCGVIATHHGLVEFAERDGASLDIGNGSLSASYYGCIRLGCETARITSWNEQSNTLAINNSGRIDLRNTTTTLCARNPRNTPVGLEHDGHVLGEDAHLVIEGSNDMAIALQKASTLTCNDIELRGSFKKAVWASSGSMFVGRFLTDITAVEADTSASINIEAISGRIAGPVSARRCGTIALPDRNVFSQ